MDVDLVAAFGLVTAFAFGVAAFGLVAAFGVGLVAAFGLVTAFGFAAARLAAAGLAFARACAPRIP